jgi:hypothetical protein
MYGTDGIMPEALATPNQEAELRHQVRLCVCVCVLVYLRRG